MAIKLGAYGKKPEYNTDEYLKKFIPLVIKHAPEYDNFSLRDLTDKMKLSNKDKLVFDDNEMQYDLKIKLKEVGYVNIFGNGSVSLTDKGRDKKNGTEPHNRISKYQKIHIGFTALSLITVIVLGALNFNLSNDKSDLIDKNNLLESEFYRYKDSVNEHIKTIKSEALLNRNDSLQSKN